MKALRSSGGRFAVLTVLVAVLAALNVVQLAMTPRMASGGSAKPTAKVRDVAAYRGAERAAVTDAIKVLDGTTRELLTEIQGLRADLTGGKVRVRVVAPEE
jgi:hypothetical protein